MMALAEQNILPIVIALLIGIAVGWWIFRSRHGTGDRKPIANGETQRAAPPAPTRPYMRAAPAHEGRGLPDHGAAAATDVAGEILGVPAHAELGGGGPPDDLQTLKGVGPRMAALLHQQGIFRFDQLAGLNANEAARIDANLGPFAGRLARDRLIEQADYLARGDRDGFEAQFGKLGQD